MAKKDRPKRTKGDVLRINITPASKRCPWIKLFRHPYGIMGNGREMGSMNATEDKKRKVVAQEIGEMVIRGSKVLKNWF